jgi:hypothetical protein
LRELQSKFSQGAISVDSLKAGDVTLPVAAGLTAALGQALKANLAQRSCDMLVTFLDNADSINKREYEGVLKAVVKSSFVGRKDTDVIIVALARCGLRKGQLVSWSDTLEVTRPLLDGALSRSYSRLKKWRVPVPVWVDANRLLVEQVLDPADLAQAMSGDAQLEASSPALHRLAAGSQVGRVLFGSAALLADAQSFANEVAVLFGKFDTIDISEDKWKEVKQEVQALASRGVAMGVASDAKRSISVCYLGDQVPMMATTCVAQVDLLPW